ncbi:MAG: leucine-rich repeat protein [Clostridia bacterium]|nr:leucine-rich repeat protein [Clostridia bacterium]
MKKFVNIISFVLVAVMCAACLVSCGGEKSFTLPTRTLVSEETKSFGNYDYQVYDDGTVKIVAYNGSETDITVPDTIDGGKVVELGVDVFYDKMDITSIKLNASLEIIGDYAFYNCLSLSNITIGKKVWSIGVAAFEGTPWLAAQTDEFVIVGDGVLLKYQGKASYLTVPDGIKHLAYAFSMNESIVGVEMGGDVLTVGKYAFAYCAALRRVVIGKNTVLIDDGAFDSCTVLTSVEIPDSVVKIASYAFNYCNNLTEVKMGKSVREIGENAFYTCLRMKLINIPVTVETIGTNAFGGCETLTLVFYEGTEEQFAALELGSTNYILKDVDKIYQSAGE